MAAGTAIAAANFSTDILLQIVDSMGSITRKIAIGCANETGGPWNAIGAYYFSGTSDTLLPHTVENGVVSLYNARKTAGLFATGAVGVFGYTLSDSKYTLGVMFSVPFDYNLYSNWWNAKVYEGSRPVDERMYRDLYDNAQFKGDDQWHQTGIGYGYTVDGCMASSGAPIFEIHIKKGISQ